jgi:hypothetical protein
MKTKVLILVGILIIAFAGIVAPVSAATTGPVAVTGTVPEYISISAAPATINLDLQPNAVASSSALVLTVSRNNPYVVTVADNTGRSGALAGDLANMQSYSGSAYTATPKLANPLHLSGTTTGTNSVHALSFPITTAQTFYDGSAAVHNQDLATSITQQVTYTDPASSTYKMELIFTIQAP